MRISSRIGGAVVAMVVGVMAAQGQEKALTPEQREKLAQAAQNPVAAMISVPFQLNTSFGTLSPYDRTQNILNIQPVIPVSINKDWNLITRTIIPVVFQPDYAASGSTTGLGDVNVSLFLSPAHPGKLIWGVGLAMAFPTGSPVDLSAGKFTAGPTFVALRIAGPWVYGMLANNTWSYAGQVDKAAVNFFYSQIFVNYNFGKTGWYATTAPVITANWEASSGNQWTVPLGGGGGKIVRLGKLPLNLGLQAYGYAVKPAGGPSWTLRSVVTVMLPR